tara:strand:- start:140 stop:259 length:120 start_codon:yes stop_codon:yes gene_type:complete
MTLLEIQLAVVRKLRELYPESKAVYNIKTRPCSRVTIML